MTPLGNPVVPDVYMIKAVSSGSTACCLSSSAASERCCTSGQYIGPGVRACQPLLSQDDNALEIREQRRAHVIGVALIEIGQSSPTIST